MRHLLSLAVLSAPFLLGPAHAYAQERPDPGLGISWTELMGTPSHLRLYGFLRTDAIYNSDRMSDPNGPVFVTSPSSSPENTHDSFTVHGRLTRLGAFFNGGELDGLGGPTISGQAEVDFNGGGSDSREFLRLRLAYLTLDWGAWSLLAGQDWDVFSPLIPAANNDTLMWYAGNTGDRRPQITARHEYSLGESDTLISEFGIAQTGAITNIDVGDGQISGEATGRPMIDGRVGWHGTNELGPYQLGLSAHQAEERFDNGSGLENFTSSGLYLDFRTPLFTDSLSFSGEWHTGKNLRDLRGGIVQGINAAGQEIRSEGGWAEVRWGLSEHTALFAGYAFEDPRNSDLDPGDASKNSVPYLAARWTYNSARIGLEYLNWSTDYVGLEDGQADRFVVWIAYDF